MTKNFPIEPTSKVDAVLEHYPELEDVLIGMAPPFKKMKNPFLRKSVGKVATLRQAAAVGRLSVEDVKNMKVLFHTWNLFMSYICYYINIDRKKACLILDQSNLSSNSMKIMRSLQSMHLIEMMHIV